MNPASASLPTTPGRMANNIARPPAPQALDTVQTPAPSIIANIPVHNQAARTAPANEDDELDKIMRDVGREMSKPEKQRKSGLLSFLHKPQTKNKIPLKATVVSERPLAAVSRPPVQTPVATQSVPAPTARPMLSEAAQVPARPRTQKSLPVFIIFVALLVTGFLSAAAIAAYRQ